MNWILKNKNSLREIILRQVKSLPSRISRSKKAKTLLAFLFVVFVFSVTISVAHAGDEGSGFIVNGIKLILVQVLQLCGWLFAVAATLFSAVVDPNNISGPNGILNKPAIKDVWIMVRDILNMTFILILLFAAFCTIFQVDKWNLKKVWLNILLNSLLVNFSFPIARFFIDVSNVAMYYFINHMFTFTGTVTGSSIMSAFSASSGISALLIPKNYNEADIAYLIAMIVFVFILGVTLLVIAALFVIRLVALAMIVMFAPVGFVGYIFPATHSYAEGWWSKLFSYSFFAPVMIFIMAVSLRILEVVKNENFQAFMSNGSTNTSGNMGNWIANAAFFLIPIIILWMGMGVAQSAGVAGAATVVGTGQKFAKWVGNQAWTGAKWTAYGNPIGRGIKEGVKEKSQFNRLAKWWKSPSSIEAAVKGGIVGVGTEKGMFEGAKKGYAGAMYNEDAKDVKEAIEKGGYDQMGPGELRDKLKTEKNRFKRAGMIKVLAEQHNLANEKDLAEIGREFGTESPVSNQIQSKVAAYDTAAAFAHIKDEKKRLDRKKAYMDSSKFKAKDQNLNTLGSVEDMEIAISSGNMSLKDLNEQRAKSPQHAKAIDASLEIALRKPEHSDVVDPVGDEGKNQGNRNLQMVFIGQTGKLHSSLAGSEKKEARKSIFALLDKDNMKRMTKDMLGPDKFGYEILQNIKPKNLKEAISSLAPNEKRLFIADVINKATNAEVANIDEIKDILKNDPEMKRWIHLNK